MESKIKIVPVTKQHIVSLVARGNVLIHPDEIKSIWGLFAMELQAFIQKQLPWRDASAYVNEGLKKNKLMVRFYPAGTIPVLRHPLVVVFKRTGESCCVFELIGLENATETLAMPYESNMETDTFVSFITNIVNKNRELNHWGIVYDTWLQIQKIPGIFDWGVTLRENPEFMAGNFLVIAENPFGAEYRYPMQFSDNNNHQVSLSLEAQIRKQIRSNPDGFHLLTMLNDIASSWPKNKSSALLLKKVEGILDIFSNRKFTSKAWSIDKTMKRKRVSVSYAIDHSGLKPHEGPGSVYFFLIPDGDIHKSYQVGFRGFIEGAAKEAESFCTKDSSRKFDYKKILTPFKKNTENVKVDGANEISNLKAPKELSRSLLKAIQKKFNISLSEISQALTIELRRMKLDKNFRIESIEMAFEGAEPIIVISQREPGLRFKFIIERRIEGHADNYGLIQLDSDDEEIRRFSLPKTHILLKPLQSDLSGATKAAPSGIASSAVETPAEKKPDASELTAHEFWKTEI